MNPTPKASDLLVLIDIQYDFLPGGALAVPGGNEISPEIHRLALLYDNIVVTQDWHPWGHSSFASSHTGAAPFSEVEMPYGPQTLWPAHCVQGTQGARLALQPSVQNKAQMVIRKGFRPNVDSYSAFLENDGITSTGLEGYMRSRGLSRAVFAGLALDYCVAFSALDARKLGFDAVVALDGCRGIAAESVSRQIEAMRAAGVDFT